MRPTFRTFLLLALCAVLPGSASGGEQNGPELSTKDEKIIYAMGLSLANAVQEFQLSEAELEILLAGFSDGALGREPKISPTLWARRIEDLRKRRVEVTRARTEKEASAFLAKAEADPGALRRPSGLIYTELQPGTGVSPKASDRVQVHYHGTRTDGSVFDSTRDRSPATFALDAVIPCWTEGLQLMKVGGKGELVCPANIAYGDRGTKGSIAPGSVLSFEVELIDIVR